LAGDIFHELVVESPGICVKVVTMVETQRWIMNSWRTISKRGASPVCLALIFLLSGLGACNGRDSAMPHEPVGVNEELAALIAQDDVAYLAQLGLMRGHLYVGMALYDAGQREAAVTHMKHPESELYQELMPGLQRRGAGEFADSLQALAIAVESGQTRSSEVDGLYRALERDLAMAEAVPGDLDVAQIAAVMRMMLGHVAEEYEIAVSPAGRMQNDHEYQDSLGFVHVINTYAAMLTEISGDANRIQGLNTQLAFLDSVFTELVPGRNDNLTLPDTVRQIVNQLQLTLNGF
jgi:hypothetical protein